MIANNHRFPSLGAHGYSLLIITISQFRFHFKNQFPYFAKELNVFGHEFEDCYDWIIQNALNEILDLQYEGGVQHHYRHDIYRCVYDTYMGMDAKISLGQEIDKHGLRFIQGERVKLLVAAENIILARSLTQGIRR